MPLLTFPSFGDVLAVAGILVVAGVPADADFPIVASVFFNSKIRRDIDRYTTGYFYIIANK